MARRNQSFSSHEDDLHSAPTGKVKGGGYALLLYLTGIGMAGSGVALALAPRISWQLTKVVRKLQPYGVDNSTLVVGGVVIFALGWVVRATVRAARSATQMQPDTSADLQLVTDQLASDLAVVKRAVSGLADRISAVAQGQQQLLEMAVSQPAADGGQVSDQQNALFRLAASLDQLGAKMDERIHCLDTEIRAKIEGVRHAVDESRSAVEARFGGQNLGGPALGGQALGSPFATVDAGVVHVEDQLVDEELDVLVELEKELLEGDEPHLEFFDTVEDLDTVVLTEEGAMNGLDTAAENPPEPRSPLPNSTLSEEALDALLPDDERI